MNRRAIPAERKQPDQSPAGRPWLLYAASNAPHEPLALYTEQTIHLTIP